MRPVAALYVDTRRGPYPAIAGVDCWGAQRDATTWPGGMPIVAHPPCGAWGGLRHFVRFTEPTLAEKRLAPIAVEQVKANGGVLEHPQRSDLWRHCNLPRPYRQVPSDFIFDDPPLWSLTVDQCDFGHKARKRTWLLFSRIRPADLPPLPGPRGYTHCVAHARYHRSHLMYLSELQRHLTPPDFAKWLVAAARRVT